jgi:hypothetical protein
MAVVNVIQIDPKDYSFTLNGSAQNPLATPYPAVPAAGVYPATGIGRAGENPYRTHLQFQAPLGAPVTYSYTNPSPNDPASALATGCYLLAAGGTYIQATSVVKGPVYFNGGAAGSGLTMTLTEC